MRLFHIRSRSFHVFIIRYSIPYSDHVVVHLLQLLLGDIHCVWRRVELVGLEGLVGEADLEGLVILLWTVNHLLHAYNPPLSRRGCSLTDGTFAGSVCEEAASVVTNLKAGRAAGATTLRLNGEAMLRLIVLDSIVDCGESDSEG
jgi:hypothetical protein